jgi:hypothetical protein
MSNVKLDLYDAIVAKLEQVDEIENVFHFNNQPRDIEDENSYLRPACLVGFSNIVWLPSKNNAMNNGTQEQNSATLEVNVTVESKIDLRGDTVSFPDHLLLIDKVYRALANLEGANFTPLQRIAEEDDTENTNVRRWEITFSTQITEPGVSLGQTDASPVTAKYNFTKH